MDSFIYEDRNLVHMVSRAQILDNSYEQAWAEKYIVEHPANKWILGHYVEASNANQNKQYFSLEDLQKNHDSLNNTPLNLNHTSQIVGTFVANDITYPKEDQAGVVNPHMEALSVFWKNRNPDLYVTVDAAHRDGALYYSMENAPEKIRCGGEFGCGQSFEFAGRTNTNYCEHLNKGPSSGAERHYENSCFMGGALIVPPVQPGWNRANIKEISEYMEDSDKAQELYDDISDLSPDLEAHQWEDLMFRLLVSFENSAATVNKAQRDKYAQSGVAMSDGSYPIPDKTHLKSAIKLVGNGNMSKSAVKAHVIRRAKALGATSMLPDSWN